eukprot:6185485-Pleurochrysis_carterae.AAC.1
MGKVAPQYFSTVYEGADDKILCSDTTAGVHELAHFCWQRSIPQRDRCAYKVVSVCKHGMVARRTEMRACAC